MRGLFGWTESLEDAHTYYGLIPDGNRTVVLALVDGRSVQAPVVHNVFIARPLVPVAAIEFRDAEGIVQTRQTGMTNDL